MINIVNSGIVGNLYNKTTYRDHVHLMNFERLILSIYCFPSRVLSPSVGGRAVSVRPQIFHSTFCGKFSSQAAFIRVKQLVPRWVRAPLRVNQYGVQTIARSRSINTVGSPSSPSSSSPALIESHGIRPAKPSGNCSCSKPLFTYHSSYCEYLESERENVVSSLQSKCNTYHSSGMACSSIWGKSGYHLISSCCTRHL